MEWTLAHPKTDARGNRRYFTLASSPTENTIRIGVKFNENGSSFKREMLEMDTSVPIVATQMAGDFTLPHDPGLKCVFIAGGIGVTPYRSMIKYLLDKNEKRPVVVMYANKTADEIAYQEVFGQAKLQLGIKTVYTLTDREQVPAGWTGRVGRIDENMIREEVPDYMERKFYLSGPHAMVTAYEEVLGRMGVPKDQIKIDFFPGFV
jgi:ferredoxin-NADP reductase